MEASESQQPRERMRKRPLMERGTASSSGVQVLQDEATLVSNLLQFQGEQTGGKPRGIRSRGRNGEFVVEMRIAAPKTWIVCSSMEAAIQVVKTIDLCNKKIQNQKENKSMSNKEEDGESTELDELPRQLTLYKEFYQNFVREQVKKKHPDLCQDFKEAISVHREHIPNQDDNSGPEPTTQENSPAICSDSALHIIDQSMVLDGNDSLEGSEIRVDQGPDSASHQAPYSAEAPVAEESQWAGSEMLRFLQNYIEQSVCREVVQRLSQMSVERRLESLESDRRREGHFHLDDYILEEPQNNTKPHGEEAMELQAVPNEGGQVDENPDTHFRRKEEIHSVRGIKYHGSLEEFGAFKDIANTRQKSERLGGASQWNPAFAPGIDNQFNKDQE